MERCSLYFLLIISFLNLSVATKAPYPKTDDFYDERTPSWLSKKMQTNVALCAKYILFQRSQISCAEVRQKGGKSPRLLKRLCTLTSSGKTVGENACTILQEPTKSQQNCTRHCGKFSCSKPHIYMQCKVLRAGLNGTPICAPVSVDMCLSKNVHHEKSSEPNPLISEVVKAIQEYREI
jgi:hypothetical protein